MIAKGKSFIFVICSRFCFKVLNIRTLKKGGHNGRYISWFNNVGNCSVLCNGMNKAYSCVIASDEDGGNVAVISVVDNRNGLFGMGGGEGRGRREGEGEGEGERESSEPS